ncbi:MAG: hotdog domain-containing protein [Promethearchaeota archaeon]
MIKQNTHLKVSKKFSGAPVDLKEGYSKISLRTRSEMITDKNGLIHGGFIFSLADYAAMLAVNHPNVVLGSANIRFIKPVVKGDFLLAEGYLIKKEGKKIHVDVNVKNNNDIVFKGEFICFTPENHILKG